MESTNNAPNFGVGGFNLGATNVAPSSLMTSRVKLLSLVVDVSPSIAGFVDDMNDAIWTYFVQALQNSHHVKEMVVDLTTFSHDIVRNFGFKPLANVTQADVAVQPRGHGTALYGAVEQALAENLRYREDLENAGIPVKSEIYIITDGRDNVTETRYKAVADALAKVRLDEGTYQTFSIFLYGVDNQSGMNAAEFRNAAALMTLKPESVKTVTDDKASLTELATDLSKSASSSSTVPSF
jgi:uncharacterized protein YegL